MSEKESSESTQNVFHHFGGIGKGGAAVAIAKSIFFVITVVAVVIVTMFREDEGKQKLVAICDTLLEKGEVGLNNLSKSVQEVEGINKDIMSALERLQSEVKEKEDINKDIMSALESMKSVVRDKEDSLAMYANMVLSMDKTIKSLEQAIKDNERLYYDELKFYQGEWKSMEDMYKSHISYLEGILDYNTNDAKKPTGNVGGFKAPVEVIGKGKDKSVSGVAFKPCREDLSIEPCVLYNYEEKTFSDYADNINAVAFEAYTRYVDKKRYSLTKRTEKACLAYLRALVVNEVATRNRSDLIFNPHVMVDSFWDSFSTVIDQEVKALYEKAIKDCVNNILNYSASCKDATEMEYPYIADAGSMGILT